MIIMMALGRIERKEVLRQHVMCHTGLIRLAGLLVFATLCNPGMKVVAINNQCTIMLEDKRMRTCTA
jgi:hypothetical protein